MALVALFLILVACVSIIWMIVCSDVIREFTKSYFDIILDKKRLRF